MAMLVYQSVDRISFWGPASEVQTFFVWGSVNSWPQNYASHMAWCFCSSGSHMSTTKTPHPKRFFLEKKLPPKSHHFFSGEAKHRTVLVGSWPDPIGWRDFPERTRAIESHSVGPRHIVERPKDLSKHHSSSRWNCSPEFKKNWIQVNEIERVTYPNSIHHIVCRVFIMGQTADRNHHPW